MPRFYLNENNITANLFCSKHHIIPTKRKISPHNYLLTITLPNGTYHYGYAENKKHTIYDVLCTIGELFNRDDAPQIFYDIFSPSAILDLKCIASMDKKFGVGS